MWRSHIGPREYGAHGVVFGNWKNYVDCGNVVGVFDYLVNRFKFYVCKHVNFKIFHVKYFDKYRGLICKFFSGATLANVELNNRP